MCRIFLFLIFFPVFVASTCYGTDIFNTGDRLIRENESHRINSGPIPSVEQTPSDQILVPADDFRNPDRYPSLGLNYNSSRLKGDSGLQMKKNDLQFNDTTIGADLRFPIDDFSLTVGGGYRTIDQGLNNRVKGISYNVSARFYLK
jgi:hypothetical protein